MWSFGVMLWEAIEMRIPYFELSNSEVVKKVSGGYHPPTPTRLSFPELFNIMEGCWKSPIERPSFRQILNKLSEIEAPKLSKSSKSKDNNRKLSIAEYLFTDFPQKRVHTLACDTDCDRMYICITADPISKKMMKFQIQVKKNQLNMEMLQIYPR